MKLEVGMYVRTKYGISKIISNPNKSRFNIDIFKKDGITLRCIRGKDVFKASHNIIDLIEVGDYVNGKLVSSLPLFKNEFIFGEPVNGVKYIKGIVGTPIEDNKDNFIKSIVTKEQFESIKYSLEG